MAVWVQSGTTTLLIYFKMVLCCPIDCKEKKQKMFVAFFGYPACPVKIMQTEEIQRRKHKKSGNASFPL
jgi:hypothetical protein